LDALLTGLGAERLTRVVDVGANPLSDPPYKFLMDRGACEVFGFEPQEEAFEELQQIKAENETYFKCAVGDGTAQTLYIYNESGLTSTFRANEAALGFLGRSARNIRLKETETLKTKRLDDLDDIPDFDVLKIDVQGSEVAVFRGGAEKLKSATVVIPEVRFYPLYEGEPMLGGVDEELRAQGFILHKFMFLKPKVLPSRHIDHLKRTQHRNQLIDGDAVYLRDLGHPEDYSDEQLKHLAIAASAIFESHDLVLHCLDHLIERKAVDPVISERYLAGLPGDLVKSLPTAQR